MTDRNVEYEPSTKGENMSTYTPPTCPGHYRDDAYWDPFAECWVACVKPVVVDPNHMPLSDPNVLYGDRYGVDWKYPGEEDR